jgi:phosphocarrier protein FPr/phosphocarrier protein
MSLVLLGAPLAGWASPLGEIPDPAFAGLMVGEGIAIDPIEGLVSAPAAGRIVAVAPTGHSVTLELANGAQILIHVGVDTVMLGGAGFEMIARPERRVAAGDALIRFDLDLVARRAKSLASAIVVANPGFSVSIRAVGRMVAIGEPLLAIERIGQAATAARDEGPRVVRRAFIRSPNGLHARPAARIAGRLKDFTARVEIESGGRTADGRSLVELLALALKCGDEAAIAAIGPDAEAAADAVAGLIEAIEAPRQMPAAARPAAPGMIAGIRASPGIAIGPVAFFRFARIEVPVDGAGEAAERGALDEAIAGLSAELFEHGDDLGLGTAHRALLEDRALLDRAYAGIEAGRGAGHSWREASTAAAQSIRATGDAVLIERIADLEDVEHRLLLRLAGKTPVLASVPEGSILVADELLPSQFLALSPAPAGICTGRGGPTSHVALLAASAGIPMVVGAGAAVLALPEGRIVLLDADSGRVDPAPDAAAIAAAERGRARAEARRHAETAAARGDCFMADGGRIEIFANLASEGEAVHAVAMGAEGCGLLRTEFLFLDRSEPPSEDEQARAYRGIAAALDDRPLIVRTLDIGADKAVPYLPLPREANPALGRRGIRLSLARPDLLSAQLRAILAGVPRGQCRIMLPMIVDLSELRAARALLEAALAAVGGEPVPLGVMVETPAAALIAHALAAEADFLSVGTNDLAQYALARDRGDGAPEAGADPFHPAVLRLIRSAAEGARRHRRWIGICGGIASDPLAAPLLIGLGANELSAPPAAIPALKAAVRPLRRDSCEALARAALACGSAAEVRALLANARSESAG